MTKVPFGEVTLGDLAQTIGVAFHATHEKMSQQMITKSVRINLQKSKYDLSTLVKDVGIKDMERFNLHHTNVRGAQCAYGFQYQDQDGKTATTYVVLVGGGMGGVGGVEGVDQGKSPAIKIFTPTRAPLERPSQRKQLQTGVSPSA